MRVNKKAVGQRIKSIRLDKGMTLEEFGKLFDATKSNVSIWEKDSSLPNAERLKQISKIADMSVDELLYGAKCDECRNQLVYICAPYRGDIELNIKNAMMYARLTYEQGKVPVTPHLMFPFLNDDKENERQDAMRMDVALLNKCHQIWVFGDVITEGMQVEIDEANRNGQVVKYVKVVD